MSYKAKIRVIRLQEQLTIARRALKQILEGDRFPEIIAEQALEAMEETEVKEGGNMENVR